MSNIRHVVVVRKDLQLVPGLLAAQVAHINDKFMREGIRNKRLFSENQLEWMKTPYLSILAVNCLEDLSEIIDHAHRQELTVNIWEDLIPSPTFPDRSIKAKVAISIGPDDFDAIKIVTGALEPY